MNISAVSFNGLKNIRNIANSQKLTAKEQDLLNKATRYHEIEIIEASDGDWCMTADKKVADNFAQALASFQDEPSSFAFAVGVDTLRDKNRAEVTEIDSKVKQATLNIAQTTPSVTKAEIIKNLDILG